MDKGSCWSVSEDSKERRIGTAGSMLILCTVVYISDNFELLYLFTQNFTPFY
jgi:hypothetical protein